MTDTGVGIEPAFLPHVFTAFSQADAPISRSFGGLGLGLAISKQIVEMHGGTISAHSEGRGKGATFIVRLPVIESADMAAAECQEASVDLRTEGNIENVSILLIEDDSSSRESLTRFLKSEKAKVTAVRTATEALEAFQNSRPSVIVSDIGLPGQDGYELMQLIRTWEAEHNVPPTPAIALTAYAGKDDSRKAREAGYQQHIAKPVNPDRLVAALVNLLSTGPA